MTLFEAEEKLLKAQKMFKQYGENAEYASLNRDQAWYWQDQVWYWQEKVKELQKNFSVDKA